MMDDLTNATLAAVEPAVPMVCPGLGHAKSADFTRALQGQAERYFPAEPLTVPVALEVEVTFTPPKAWSARKRAAEFYRVVGTDASAMAGLIVKALGGYAYESASQVSRLKVDKVYGDHAQTSIVIRPLA